jgi:pimeloyl-ACP methyl ester carboxylesterase
MSRTGLAGWRVRYRCSPAAMTARGVGASEEMARRLPDAEFVVFENSAHVMVTEEQHRYLATVRQFLNRVTS